MRQPTWLAVLLLLCATGFARAQDGGSGGIAMGAFTLYPTLGITFEHDDNVTLARFNEVESDVTILAPALQLVASGSTSRFALRYELQDGTYHDSRVDDYTDHRLTADLAVHPSVRHDFRFVASYVDSHDRRGTGLREGDIGLLLIRPDRWEEYGVGGTWRYGAAGAKGALEIEANTLRRKYTNHRDVTRLLDRRINYIAGRFFYRVRPKTELLTELRWADIDYDVSPYDAEQTSLLFGVRWDATYKTSGRALFGIQRREFDDPSLETYDGTAWEVGVTWSPRTYSIFDLSTIRNAAVAEGNAAYTVRQETVLRWDHYWKPRFNSTVEVGYSDYELRPGLRDDYVNFWGVGAQYLARPWLRFGFAHRYFDRDSTLDEFIYDRNLTQLTMELSVP